MLVRVHNLELAIIVGTQTLTITAPEYGLLDSEGNEALGLYIRRRVRPVILPRLVTIDP